VASVRTGLLGPVVLRFAAVREIQTKRCAKFLASHDMKTLRPFFTTMLLATTIVSATGGTPRPIAASEPASPAAPKPTRADVAYGPHPDELLDVYLPPQGNAPFPVVIHFGTLWKASKRAPGLKWYADNRIAFVMVQMRTMTEAYEKKVDAPVSWPLLDARRAVQFVRFHAKQWQLDPERILLMGSSQGSLPALYVGCSGEKATPNAADPVERVSTKVSGVVAFISQPSIDPKQMQDWVPGVKWGEPALGCSFDESLKRRDELLPKIKQWSPDYLLGQGSAPIYFHYTHGLTKPTDVKLMPYLVHSPKWALGFQKLAQKQDVPCYVDFPEHPAEKYPIAWDFVKAKLANALTR
jgi:acetyl esterase/lipase